MPTLDVAIFETADLHSHCDYNYNDPWRAAKRAKTWIEGAFSNTNNWSVSVTIGDETPNPKNEGGCHQEFTQCCLCSCNNSISQDCMYNNLFDYWGDWLWEASCKDPHTEATDCNLLLTNYRDGGGLGTSELLSPVWGKPLLNCLPPFSVIKTRTKLWRPS
jgi:hypothetical protein